MLALLSPARAGLRPLCAERLLAACAALLLAACAGAPPPPAPGRSQAWGELRLVPREGVSASSGGGSYGDRRLRDVELVDYSKPGFAVVYVEEAPAPAGELALRVRADRVGTAIEPAHGAVGAAGRIVVHNESPESHLLSYPAAGVVARLEPGETAELAVPRAGEQGLFLLDVPDAAATVFAAPGPFAVVSSAGRYALRDLAPGRRELRAWHPRFPPAVQPVELAADAAVRVDFELGVGRSEGHEHAH
jgi:hypothetical protein